MSSTITLAGISGAVLAVDPRQLPDSVGVSVIDADPGHGDLRPLRAALPVASVPASPQRKTIYRLGRDTISDTLHWLSWSGIVHAVRGFDGADTSERTYFTGAGTPKWTDNIIGLAGGAPYPQGTRELAVPAPTEAPQVEILVNGTTGTDSTVFYVTTFVNDLGWESAPSPVSVGVTIKPGATLNIGNILPLEAPPAGSYGINRRRIYRTQSATSGNAEFYFLREVPIATTATTDDARPLGAMMEVAGWIPPPADGHSLIALWGGMMAMLSGKRILFSEPNKPYTYPERYDIPTLDKPLATAKWGEQNMLVLTTGRPVLCQGTSPEGMDDSQLALSQPLASVQSVVSFGHGVCWASNEGLAYAGSGGQAMLTAGILTPQQWRAMVPSSMVAGRYGRFYVCSYTVAGVRKGFMLDPLKPTGIWYLSEGFDACFYDDLADALFVLVGGEIRKFDAGAPLVPRFTSKRYMQTAPRNFSVAKVVATAFPVTVTITARNTNPDGTERLRSETRIVTSERAFTLRDGFLSDDWQIETTGPIQAVRLAMDVRDLRGL